MKNYSHRMLAASAFMLFDIGLLTLLPQAQHHSFGLGILFGAVWMFVWGLARKADIEQGANSVAPNR